MHNELVLFQEFNTQENATVQNFAQLRCYQGLPLETIETLEEYVTDAKRIVNKASFDLAEIFCNGRKLYRHNKHGGFEGWIEERFKIGRRTAYNMIWRYEQFGTVQNFEQLDIVLSAQYALSQPATPQEARDEAIQRAEEGEKITVKVSEDIVEKYKAEADRIKQELEAERKAHTLFREDAAFNERVREQAHVALVQSLEQQLGEKPEPEKVVEYQDTLETASKIDELETLIDFLEAKPDIPPETQTELDKLNLELKNAKTELGFYEDQNKALADKNRQLSEESRRSFVDNITAVGQLRIRQEWQAATSVLQASHSAFHLKIPSQIDRESFEGEEHTRTAQTIEVLEETIARLKQTLPHSGNTLERADIIDAELFPMPVIHEAKRPVIGIPPEYDELFAEYKQAVRSYPEPELLWNAQDQGYPHHMIEPEKHIQFTKELLSSEVDRRVKAAVEAMKRTLGIWEDAIHAHRQETLSS